VKLRRFLKDLGGRQYQNKSNKADVLATAKKEWGGVVLRERGIFNVQKNQQGDVKKTKRNV